MNLKLMEDTDLTVVGPTRYIRIIKFKRFQINISFSDIHHHMFSEEKKIISVCSRIGIRINFHKRAFAFYTEQFEKFYEITEEYSLAT